MSADVQMPLVGRTTLTPADGAVLLKATTARFGFFNQPRLLLYCALLAMLAALYCIYGYDIAPKVLLLLAFLLFLLAIVVGTRTVRTVGRGYGYGQEREIQIDDDGVTVREPGMTVNYAWSRFLRVIDSSDHFALVAGVGVLVFPKRAFTPDTLIRVREVIAAKMPAEARIERRR